MDSDASKALTRVTEFEGHKVITVVWQGRPVWVAREVGEALGYSDGSRVVDKITGEWSAEFIEGTDFDLLTNGRLAAFKALLGTSSPGGNDIPPNRGDVDRTARLVILYESGLHLALLKTRKPAGRRLRRLLAAEVLPQLVRTGQYAPSAPPVPILPPPLVFGDLADWPRYQRAALRRVGDVIPAAFVDRVASLPVIEGVVVSASLVASLAGLLFDHTPLTDIPKLVQGYGFPTRPRAASPSVTFRTQSEWPWVDLRAVALQTDAVRKGEVPAPALDAVADWPVPPGTRVCPALVVELARVCRDFVPPSRLLPSGR